MPGTFKHVSVDITGRVWGIDQDDTVWTKPGYVGDWFGIGGTLKQLVAGYDRRIWGIDKTNKIWTRNGPKGQW